MRMMMKPIDYVGRMSEWSVPCPECGVKADRYCKALPAAEISSYKDRVHEKRGTFYDGWIQGVIWEQENRRKAAEKRQGDIAQAIDLLLHYGGEENMRLHTDREMAKFNAAGGFAGLKEVSGE